jgi:hypothetical protein
MPKRPTLDAALETARDGAAFPNGTTWANWAATNCDRCLRERPLRNGMANATGCPLVIVAVVHGKTPAEWVPDTERTYRCTAFVAPGPSGRPKRIPTRRGQLVLFSDRPYRVEPE